MDDKDNPIPDDIMTVINSDLPDVVKHIPEVDGKSDPGDNSDNKDEVEDAPQWEFDSDEKFMCCWDVSFL